VADKPLLSVIIPLGDHRGHALEAIESWTRQTCPREDYEVIVITDGREPELEAAVARLAAGGLLIMEFGLGQDDAVTALVDVVSTLDVVAIRHDLQDIPRTVICRRNQDAAR